MLYPTNKACSLKQINASAANRMVWHTVSQFTNARITILLFATSTHYDFYIQHTVIKPSQEIVCTCINYTDLEYECECDDFHCQTWCCTQKEEAS